MRKDVHAILASLPDREKLGALPPKEVVRLYDVLVALVMSLLVRLQAAFADVEKLRQENYKLQRRLNTNPGNSGVPPSQAPLDYRREDNPPADPSADGAGAPSEQNERDGQAVGQAEKPDDGKDSEDSGDSKKPRKTKVGAKEGHPGHRQKLLTPDEEREIQPGPCPCGCTEFDDLRPCHRHQHLEIPKILVWVIHFILFQGRCRGCGKIVKATIPQEFSTGYGPTLTSLVGSLVAVLGSSRRNMLSLLHDPAMVATSRGESLPLSHGGLNRLINRCSEALKAAYDKIAEIARTAPINHIDESMWRLFGPEGKAAGKTREYIWVMVSAFAAFFRIDPSRSREAFLKLIGDWHGILVSDDYALYCTWPAELRQACLAHLLRAAKKLAQDPDPDIARGGKRLYKELCRLTKLNRDILTEGEWRVLNMRLKGLINKLKTRDDGLGTLALRLEKNYSSLYTFLRIAEVEPTNNRAERTIRPAVVRRKTSYGSASDAGRQWTQRSLSVLMTCRMHGWSFCGLLHEAVTNLLRGEPQDLSRFEAVKQQALQAREKLGLEPTTP